MKLQITNFPHRFVTKSGHGDQGKLRIALRMFFVFCALILTLNTSLVATASAAEWGGVDESVVEKYAEEHGRAARDPYINTDQGDLLLFVFLLAGAVGGFIGGYYWRVLMEKAPQGSGASGHKAQT